MKYMTAEEWESSPENQFLMDLEDTYMKTVKLMKANGKINTQRDMVSFIKKMVVF